MSEQCSGSLFIVAAPSGGGKTSLIKHLVACVDRLVVSVSHTTRDQRPGEEDGIHYFFISETQFEMMIDANQFVEHARVFNHFYGTSHEQIHERLQQGMDVILDIDWQGAAQIKHFFPDAIGIFILPPSLHALENRLKNRQRDDVDVIRERMRRACEELSHYDEFDYLVVNDDFEKAASELAAIITSCRLKVTRQVLEQRKLLSFLLASQ
jgi:guanylate kinase